MTSVVPDPITASSRTHGRIRTQSQCSAPWAARDSRCCTPERRSRACRPRPEWLYTDCTQNRFTMSHLLLSLLHLGHNDALLSCHILTADPHYLHGLVLTHLYSNVCRLTVRFTSAHLLGLGHSVGHWLYRLHQLGGVVTGLLLHVLALHLIVTVAWKCLNYFLDVAINEINA